MRLTLLMFAFAVLTASHECLAEEPRGYIARPLEAGTPYSSRAQQAYAAGVWTLDELEHQQPDAERTRVIYTRALAAFNDAVSAEPSMYEAHTYLGYIHRQLGDFDSSLRAYQRALALKADYVYAIEYLGEAYLGVNDFVRARFSYLRLYALDQKLAAKLLDAIRTWAREPADSDARRVAREWLLTQEH